MDKIWISKTTRFYFGMISLFFLVIILLINYLALPVMNVDIPVLKKVLDDIFSAGFTTIFIAYLVFWLTPKVMHKSDMEVIIPNDIGDKLKECRDTHEYWYSGGTGRYTRAVTLPQLAKSARSSNRTKIIHLQLIDPTNIDALKVYADYRNMVKTGIGERWDNQKVKEEVYATIASAYIWKVEQPLLEINVSLRKEVSLFRYDLSTKGLVITKEDNSEPALFCSEDSFFHKAYSEELRLRLKQNKKLASNIETSKFKELTIESLKKLFQDLSIYNVALDDVTLENVRKQVIYKKNPYA